MEKHMCTLKSEEELGQLDWEKGQGLLPAVIQDEGTRQVLMVGMMSPESLRATLQDRLVTFYSRTRKNLWRKGESSGHLLSVLHISTDCDRDCLLIKVRPHGPTCHRNTTSCFGLGEAENQPWDFMAQLESLIGERYLASLKPPSEDAKSGSFSYTESLLRKGIKRCAQKVGEEGVETALAAVSADDVEVISETSDLIYHLMVMLASRQIPFSKIIDELKNRNEKRVK
jgi:phosphoribosyl-ATP pyrophosphohydrolase/phosphoribosyl-AMP cyclohydrolase